MHPKIKLYCLLAGSWAMTGVLTGEVYHVAMPSAGGDDGNSGLDWTEPKASISNALAQENVNAILVSNGTYNLADVVNISKPVTIRSWNNGAVDRDGTIMVGAGTNRCFWLAHAGAVVDGFTITNGFCEEGVLQTGGSASSAGRGGGVYMAVGGMLTNCLVVGNAAFARADGRGGGGVYMSAGSLWNCRIAGNIVSNPPSTNSYREGGGGVLVGSSGMVVNCEIDNNRSYSGQYAAGGVKLYNGGWLENCDISNNFAKTNGGGVYARMSGVITNCRITGNTVEHNGGGIFIHADNPGSDFGVVVVDCLISNNVSKRTQYNTSSGGGVFIYDGTNHCLRNCVIVTNTSGREGGGVYMTAGFIEGGAVCNNVNLGANFGGGGICALATATNMLFIRDVNISGNWNNGGIGGGGVIMRNALLENSIIHGNIITNSLGGGIHAYGTSVVVNCRIANNFSYYRGGGLSVTDSTIVRNCLISGNIATNALGGGIYTDNNFGGEISACTITDNEVQGDPGFQRGAGIIVVNTNNIFNCLVWSNRWSGTLPEQERDLGMYAWIDDLAAQSNSVHYCCSPRDFGGARGNITNPPSFVGIAGENWRLAGGSAGINAGTNLPWMLEPGAMDLDGRPRRDRFSRQADMGCYEYLPQGVMFSLH